MAFSIRQRLLIVLLSLTIISWSTIAIINYIDARDEIEEIFDAQLIQSAKVLLSLVDHELYEEIYLYDSGDSSHRMELQDIKEHLFRHKYEKLLAFQISVNNGNFSFKSAEAPEQSLSDDTEGFSEKTVDGVHWRVYTLHDADNIIVVRTAEPYTVRSDLIREIALNLLIPLLIGLPVISILIWKIIGIIFNPLNKIATNIQQRNSARLDPVSGYDVPAEIRPLITALNGLFYRLDKVIQNERRFTADAAHELRTPLAGLKTQAQIAMRISDPRKSKHAIKNILKSVERMTHIVEQLLTLARLEPGLTETIYENCDLTQLIQGSIADVSTLAIDKNITLEFNYEHLILLPANPYAFSMLIRNLLDNAIRYTPSGGRVDISLFEDLTDITMRVADNGPGIPENIREDVFKHFYRPENMREPGSGLGLSIVKRIAELHHAEIRMDKSVYNGLQVDVTFPVAHPSGKLN
jgi:two-component system, OmpR family, sensor histidine kinase QseC